MKFTLIRLMLAIMWMAIAYMWGDWKNWRKYYPTLLFYAMGDFIYNVVFSNKRLWIFEVDLLVAPINTIFVTLAIFMPNILVFLSNYPKKLLHQFIYIALWIAIYMLIEIFTTSIGMQKNFNGWNIWWSLLHNVIVFPLLIIHTKNPILAWVIAFAFLGYIMYVFKVPALLMLLFSFRYIYSTIHIYFFIWRNLLM